MNMDEFMQLMLAAFPDAEVESDQYGNLMVHTNMRLVGDEVITVV